MRRVMVVLSVGVVVAMAMAMYALPAMAQVNEKQAQREAQREANRAQIAEEAARQGIDTPEEAAALYGVDTPEEAAAPPGGEAPKAAPPPPPPGGAAPPPPPPPPPDKSDKALPKTGGVGIGSFLGLGAGALLIGGGLLARKIAGHGYRA